MARFKFTIEAGVLLRNKVRREIERYSFEQNIKLDIKENRGFIDSEFYIVMEGTDNQIRQAQRDITTWMNNI